LRCCVSTVQYSTTTAAAQRRGGRELTRWLRLGRPLWAGPSPPCQPANPPARQILSRRTLGACPVFTCPAACFAHTLHSAAASTSLSFSFSFPTPPPPAPPVLPLLFFSLCARTAAISKEASFRVPFAVVVFRPLSLVLPAVVFDSLQPPPRVSTSPILARQLPRRTRIRAVLATWCP